MKKASNQEGERFVKKTIPSTKLKSDEKKNHSAKKLSHRHFFNKFGLEKKRKIADVTA